jgi:hypothetical protein
MKSIDVNSLKRVTTDNSLYPTLTSIAASIINDSNSNDDKTVVTLNLNASQLPSRIHQANAMMINPTHAVVDTGATSLFVMEGTNCKNKRIAINPITISLPDGKKVTSTHICNGTIPGLPFTLIGDIVPKMMMASLLGIRVLCKAGCQVSFDDKKCKVIYKGKVILTGIQGPNKQSMDPTHLPGGAVHHPKSSACKPLRDTT